MFVGGAFVVRSLFIIWWLYLNTQNANFIFEDNCKTLWNRPQQFRLQNVYNVDCSKNLL